MPAPSRAPIIGITCDVTDRDALIAAARALV